MSLSKQRRLVWVTALSLVLHAAVLLWLAWPRAADLSTSGPDLSSMTVELLRPVRPERRMLARTAPRPRVEPAAKATSRISEVAAAPSVSIPEGLATIPAPAEASLAQDNLRAALRAGAGCTRAMARSREEREACEERLGRLAADAPRYDAPMDPEKRAYYAEVAASGPSGGTYGDPQPAAVTPGGAAYARVLNCSMSFGAGRKAKDRQGMVRLGKTPCSIPLQGSFFTPEASVRKR